jgi:hypothetical protein
VGVGVPPPVPTPAPAPAPGLPGFAGVLPQPVRTIIDDTHIAIADSLNLFMV